MLHLARSARRFTHQTTSGTRAPSSAIIPVTILFEPDLLRGLVVVPRRDQPDTHSNPHNHRTYVSWPKAEGQRAAVTYATLAAAYAAAGYPRTTKGPAPEGP